MTHAPGSPHWLAKARLVSHCCTPEPTKSNNNKNKPNYKTQRRASQCMHAPEGPVKRRRDSREPYS